MRYAFLAVVALQAFVAGPAFADDEVENPEFTNWSQFKKGTSVTRKSTNTIRNKPNEQTVTVTLVAVEKNKLTIETEVVIVVQGTTLKPNRLQEDIPKMIKVPKGMKKEDFLAGKPEGTFEDGTETLDVNGVKVKTRWFKFKTETPKAKSEGKVWLSAEVPGRIVRQDRFSGGEIPETSLLTVTDIKKP